MSVALSPSPVAPVSNSAPNPAPTHDSASSSAPDCVRVIRRNGQLTPFDHAKIASAMTKAFLAVEGAAGETSQRIRDVVERLTKQVVDAFNRRPDRSTIHIEEIQDQVELSLMRAGEHKTARAYVLYREARSKQRVDETGGAVLPTLHVVDDEGMRRLLDWSRIQTIVREACRNLDDVAADIVLHELGRTLYDGVPQVDVARALVMAARTQVE